MASGRTVKLVLYEVLQFACLCVPVFVVMERFASLMRHVKSDSFTAYWLVVATSIAYVTSVTLLVWVPLKYVILKSRGFFSEVVNWRPVTLAYVILSPLPCFALFIASSKVQVDASMSYDIFTELPVSLVVFCLICVDIVERIRPYKLTGPANRVDSDFNTPSPVLTHLEQVSSVSAHIGGAENSGTPSRTDLRNGSASAGAWAESDGYATPRFSGSLYLYSSHSHSDSLNFLWRYDPRHHLLVDSFLFWLDTAEMVRVGGLDQVFFSAWVFPVYILALLSMFRLVVMPRSALLLSLGVLLQDLPFLVVRVGLIATFGFVTPVLYALKNLLVCLTFIYFVFMTKLKLFNRGSMF